MLLMAIKCNKPHIKNEVGIGKLNKLKTLEAGNAY